MAVRGADHRAGTAADHSSDQSISHASIFREGACLHADTQRLVDISRTLAGRECAQTARTRRRVEVQTRTLAAIREVHPSSPQ
jgi:hypothetical protein